MKVFFYGLVSMVANNPWQKMLFLLIFADFLPGNIFRAKKSPTSLFLPTDHETNKIHILLHVTVHKTTQERIDRRYCQIWPLSSRSNDRSIDHSVAAPQPLSRRSLQSQQGKPVYFWYSGRSMGSWHTWTLCMAQRSGHIATHVQIF